jgi:hypothetical protein
MAAQEVSGLWKRQNVTYTNAQVWGTGINPIHYYYGSDPDRVQAIRLEEGQITPVWESVPEQLEGKQLWGYQAEDSTYTGVDLDDRPRWDQCTYETRTDTGDQPSWAAPGAVTEAFRTRFGGAYRIFRGRSQAQSDVQYQIPSETVSEGWENKPQGTPADAKPSDDKQLIVQTSMTQRYQTRVNNAAVARGTDDPRAPIASKVTGQRLKVYSGGERHYDMFPKQQDTILRPFWYRTAGTGRVNEMVPNTMWSITALERIPPADPSLGTPETDLTSEYGYTTEDGQYYA